MCAGSGRVVIRRFVRPRGIEGLRTCPSWAEFAHPSDVLSPRDHRLVARSSTSGPQAVARAAPDGSRWRAGEHAQHRSAPVQAPSTASVGWRVRAGRGTRGRLPRVIPNASSGRRVAPTPQVVPDRHEAHRQGARDRRRKLKLSLRAVKDDGARRVRRLPRQHAERNARTWRRSAGALARSKVCRRAADLLRLT